MRSAFVGHFASILNLMPLGYFLDAGFVAYNEKFKQPLQSKVLSFAKRLAQTSAHKAASRRDSELLFQPDAPDQFIKTRVVAQVVKTRLDIQHHHLTLMLFDGFAQIFKRLFLVAEPSALPCHSIKIG